MSTSKKKIVLKSSDDMIFEVEEEVAIQLKSIAQIVEDDMVGDGITLPYVTGEILSLVIEYCKKHMVDGDGGGSSLTNWDAEFMNGLDQSVTLFKLTNAAKFLDVQSLVDLTCQTIATMIEGKTVEEVREIFDVENDYTPEEEAKIRQDNHWAFE